MRIVWQWYLRRSTWRMRRGRARARVARAAACEAGDEEACEEGFSIISPGEHIPSQAVAPACKLPEDALEQTVTLLVYVPVFAYTFAASLPAEEQFVLGLVVILIVGSFAKQDD